MPQMHCPKCLAPLTVIERTDEPFLCSLCEAVWSRIFKEQIRKIKEQVCRTSSPGNGQPLRKLTNACCVELAR